MNPILIKICSCGKAHEVDALSVDVTGEELFAGYYFNCECKSTLFVPLVILEKHGYVADFGECVKVA